MCALALGVARHTNAALASCRKQVLEQRKIGQHGTAMGLA